MVDIQFCDRCHESIPDPDFDSGKAVRIDGRAMHVACALRRAIPGSGRTLTFLLACVAAGAATYAAVRVSQREEAPAGALIAADWKSELAGAEERLSKRIEGARAADQRAIEESANGVRAQLDTEIAKFDGRVSQLSDQSERRFRSVDKDIQEITNWVREVKDLATRTQPATPAPGGNADAPEPPVAPPAPPPVAPPPPIPTDRPGTATPADPPPAPTPPAPPADPEAEKRRDAEVDRWIERLRDREAGIAFSATVQLGRLKHLRAVPALVNTLKSHSDFYTRLGAATALGELKAVDAVPALIEALEDKDDLVQTAASEALTGITGQDFKFVVNLSKKERKVIREQWTKWWQEHETDLRKRLNQPLRGT